MVWASQMPSLRREQLYPKNRNRDMHQLPEKFCGRLRLGGDVMNTGPISTVIESEIVEAVEKFAAKNSLEYELWYHDLPL